MEIRRVMSSGLVKTRGSMMGKEAGEKGEVVLICTVPRERGFWSTTMEEGSPLKKTSNNADSLEA